MENNSSSDHCAPLGAPTAAPAAAPGIRTDPSVWWNQLLFFTRIRRHFTTAYHTSPSFTILFLCSLCFTLFQLVATFSILVLARDCRADCEQPLYFLLTALVILVALSIPLQYLEAKYNIEGIRLLQQASDLPLSAATLENTMVHAFIRRQVHEEYFSYASPLFFQRKERIDRLNRIVEIQILLLLMFGNFWVFPSSGTSCASTCPLLYNCALIWVIYGYFLILMPFFLVMGVFFCLPLVLLANRIRHAGMARPSTRVRSPLWIDWLLIFQPGVMSGVGGPTDVHQSPPYGLAPEEIEQIPEVAYHPNGNESASTQSTATFILEECAICLSPFISGETVRKLPCRHIFHKECIGTWLKSSHTCPLCLHNLHRQGRPSV